MIVLVMGATGAAVWANVWKADLRIREVRVEGNSVVKEQEILSLANITKGQKVFEVDLFAAQKRVLQNQFVRSVSINREAPNRISIVVEERVPIAAVLMDRIVFVDVEGYVLPPVVSDKIFDLPVLSGTLPGSEFVPGHQVATAHVKEGLQILAVARELDDELYRRISEVRVNGEKDILFYTAEAGVPVILGRGDVGVKLVKFNAFWNEFVVTHGAHELVSVDLRYADQVVVRWNHDSEEIKAAGESSRPEGKRKRSALFLPATFVR